MNINQIPTDILQYQLLLDLPTDQLLSLCQVNKRLNSICQQDQFWKDKLLHDYPVNIDQSSIKVSYRGYQFELPIVVGKNWKQYYFELARYLADYWQIPIFYQNRNIGYITIEFPDTIYNVKIKIIDFLKKTVDSSIAEGIIYIPQLNVYIEDLVDYSNANKIFYDKWFSKGFPQITFNIVGLTKYPTILNF